MTTTIIEYKGTEQGHDVNHAVEAETDSEGKEKGQQELTLYKVLFSGNLTMVT